MNQDPGFHQEIFSPTPQLEASQPPSPTAPSPDRLRGQMMVEKEQLERQFAAGASWFFWIAGLSLVNSIISLFGGTLHFIFGLGLTQVVDGLVAGIVEGVQAHGGFRIVALFFDLAIAGLFVLFGFLSGKRMHWPFIVGMVIYTLDALLLLLFGDYLSAAVHGYVLYRMYTSVSAIRRLRELDQIQ